MVFRYLPFADAGRADEQNETGGFGDLVSELRRPGASSAQVRGREEDAGLRILALDGVLEPLGQRLVGGVIAEKPTRHAVDLTEVQHIELLQINHGCLKFGVGGERAARPRVQFRPEPSQAMFPPPSGQLQCPLRVEGSREGYWNARSGRAP